MMMNQYKQMVCSSANYTLSTNNFTSSFINNIGYNLDMYKDVNDFVTTNFMVFNDAMIGNVIICLKSAKQ